MYGAFELQYVQVQEERNGRIMRQTLRNEVRCTEEICLPLGNLLAASYVHVSVTFFSNILTITD